MAKTDSTPWPEEHLRQLKVMVLMGCSAREIGERLGYSKNAVMGKAHRKKLSFKKCIKTNNGRTRATGQYLKTPLNSDCPPREPMGEGCLWPIGDKWCGCERASGEPYCHMHVRTAWGGMQMLPLEETLKLLNID